MRIHKYPIGFILCSAFITSAAFCATSFPSAQPSAFSKDGQIQNVQNYSSNPFWTPDAPYNQRMPQAVYIQEMDLNTADCQTVVAAVIASYCGANNKCKDISLNDAKSAIIVQLASLPNHNYAASCNGFIDSAFTEYKRASNNAAPTGGYVAFPGATAPNQNAAGSEFKIENPYAPQLPTWNGDPWLEDIYDRAGELKDLQAQNGAGNEKIVKASFPTTAGDLSFSEKMVLKTEGYEPFKDKSAYKELNLESEEDALARQKLYEQRANTYCTEELAKLPILQKQLEDLKKCQSSGIAYEDCTITTGA